MSRCWRTRSSLFLSGVTCGGWGTSRSALHPLKLEDRCRFSRKLPRMGACVDDGPAWRFMTRRAGRLGLPVAVGVALLALLAVSCAADSGTGDSGAAPDSSVATLVSGSAEPPLGQRAAVGAMEPGADAGFPLDMPLAEFDSMWSYQPGDPHDDIFEAGLLHIEAPCAYLAPLGAPMSDDPLNRMQLFLPKSGTRYDAATGSLWIWRNGPFVEGDYVIVGGNTTDKGTGGRNAIPCAASRAVSARTMEHGNRTEVDPSSTVEVPAAGSAPLAQFSSMWDFHFGEPYFDDELSGRLAVESWCAFVDVSGEVDDAALPTRSELLLPRSGTRYDDATDSLWVWHDGPFHSGDSVTVVGRGTAESLSTPCSHSPVWYATSMNAPELRE